MTYPETPGFVAGSDTSTEAALRKEPTAETDRATILALVRRAAKGGMTCEEVELYTRMPHQGASARIRELVLGGWIYDSGSRRLNTSGRRARVYLATPQGDGQR